MSGLLVTATDTGVGKSFLAAAICAAIKAEGRSVVACKPIVTGLDEPAPAQGFDHELLASCTGQTPQEVSPWRFGPAVSPHLAIELAQSDAPTAEQVVSHVRSVMAGEATAIVEGIGGLLVPISRQGFDVRALAIECGLDLVLAARPGLGTINHTLLTVEAIEIAGLNLKGIVMTPWLDGDLIAEDNRRTISEALPHIQVHTLPMLRPSPDELAAAGSQLPIDSWLNQT